MNENTNPARRREWVKNAAIIFLTIMLLLTFFSNTIMNYSLPEVATEYVQSGSITEKVRGTGTIEATDPYNVIVDETRVISSVAVKQGDEVEKDQVLYYLEDKESDELKTAEEELEDLKLSYMKGLFGNNVSSEIITKVANGNVDGFAALQAKVGDMQKKLDAAQKRVKDCQEALETLTLQSTVNTNNATINTIGEENQKAEAGVDLANAQTAESNAEAAFTRMKSEKMADLQYQIRDLEEIIKSLQDNVSNAEGIAGSVGGSFGTGDGDGDSAEAADGSFTSGGIDVYIERREAAKQVVAEKLSNIYGAAKQDPSYTGGENIDELRQWINESDDRYQTYATLLNDYDAAVSQYEIAVELADDAANQLGNHDGNKSELERREGELRDLQARLAEVEAMVYTPGDSVQAAQDKLNQADRNLTDKMNANKQASVAYQNQLANAEAALKNAQAVYDLLKEEQTEMNADINAELDLAKISDDIAKKEEEIEELKEKAIGASIKSPVAGTVTSLAYKAGESTKPGEAAAVMQVAGKGYTMAFSATNDQAKKLSVGDMAELQNAWYYDDVKVTLASIRPDPNEPAQKKQLTFKVDGDVQAGQSLSLSIGQKSMDYELVVPNSAIREDNNGKFILIVESKSSPLGNRYIATRVDVEVLASDDTHTAITAGIYGYEYVITTATKPVEAGKQVRLTD